MPPKSSKKLSKGKEKKLKRKQEQAEVALSLEKVQSAYQLGDYMDYFVPFRNFSRNGIAATISFNSPELLKEHDIKEMFDILKDNMKSLYISGGWGWNDPDKLDELTHPSSRYLLARDSNAQKLLGFISFRFDLDQDIEVLYCYEVQLVQEVRRKGLGKFLMQLLELIGYKASMRKIVLTIFKENIVSNRFFREMLGYQEDDSSPLITDPLNPEDYTYSILSKLLLKHKTPQT